MSGQFVGRVTTRPAESFVRDGTKFVRFFPVDGQPRVAEVFDAKAFEAERGESFFEFCERQDKENDAQD